MVGWWVVSEKKTKLMLYSTLVEVRVELGKKIMGPTKILSLKIFWIKKIFSSKNVESKKF